MTKQGLIGDVGDRLLLGRTSSNTYVTVDPSALWTLQLWKIGKKPLLLDTYEITPPDGYAFIDGDSIRAPHRDGHPPGLNRHWTYPITASDAGDVVLAEIYAVTTGPVINSARVILTITGTETISVDLIALETTYIPLEMHMAADSSQVVVLTASTINFYDLPGLVLSSSIDRPDNFTPGDWLTNTVENPYSGYIVAVPSQNRVLWKNTSPDTITVVLTVTDVDYHGDTGLSRSFTATYDCRPLAFRSTIISESGYFAASQVAHPPQDSAPTSGQMYWNGSAIGPDLASLPWFLWGTVDVPIWYYAFTAFSLDMSGIGSSSTEYVEVECISDTGTTYNWGWNRAIVNGNVSVLVDNSEANGGHIELLDETGAVLDSIAYVAESDHLHKWMNIDGLVGYLRYPGRYSEEE